MLVQVALLCMNYLQMSLSTEPQMSSEVTE